jgi:aminoglycoside phosphotransferase (APT) family kinase protein
MGTWSCYRIWMITTAASDLPVKAARVGRSAPPIVRSDSRSMKPRIVIHPREPVGGSAFAAPDANEATRHAPCTIDFVTGEVETLIASGRDGDIFALGPSLVLRKTRDGRSIEDEARVMEYAADHGYPVPAIEGIRAGGSEIVMERVDGPMMMDVMAKQPWTLPHYASMLADLHDQLHEIPAPDWVPRLPDDGDRLIHLDLHPMNVILSHHGPVVIDWANASAGEAMSDIAASYVLLTCPEMPASRLVQLLAQPARAYLARAFVRRYRGPSFKSRLAFMAELKALDKNMTATEIAACHRLAHRSRTKGTA